MHSCYKLDTGDALLCCCLLMSADQRLPSWLSNITVRHAELLRMPIMHWSSPYPQNMQGQGPAQTDGQRPSVCCLAAANSAAGGAIARAAAAID